MRLAGWDKDIIADANIEEFLNQAVDYKDMINGNAWNKTLEFLVLSGASHPLMAVRATECGEWANSDLFNRILNNIPDPVETKPEEKAAEQTSEQGQNQPFDLFGFLRPKKQETVQQDKKPENKAEASEETEDTAAADVYKELHWYKKMADEGLITQEQYEQKKKEMLGQ